MNTVFEWSCKLDLSEADMFLGASYIGGECFE